MLGQTDSSELHVLGSDSRAWELLEPLSEQSLCKSKSGVSALVTRELSQGNVGFVQLGEMQVWITVSWKSGFTPNSSKQ